MRELVELVMQCERQPRRDAGLPAPPGKGQQREGHDGQRHERRTNLAACFRDGANHFERLVAIEWSDLDGDDLFDLREPPPE